MDILERKKDVVHRLLWKLVLHYGIHYQSSTPMSQEAEFLAVKRVFLTWINCILTDLRVTNLHTDWRDGRVLSALVNYCNPGSISNYNSLDPAKAYANVRSAMNLAEMLGIPQLIATRDFTASRPDERSILLYLSYFVPYGQKSFLKWVKTQLPDADLLSFSQDWVDGKLLAALVNAVSEGKFESHASMNSLDGVSNIEKSMIAAEKMLGIRKTLTPEEFGNASLDLIARLSYLSQFYRTKIEGNATVLIPPAPEKVGVGQIQIPRSIGDGKSVWVELDCSDAGYGSVRAEVQGKQTGTLPVVVKALDAEIAGESNQYHVMFTPPKVDIYTLSVFFADDHVNGSPFTVNLHPPDERKVRHLETSPPKEDKKELSMSFDTGDAGQGKLKATASGEIGGSIPIKVVLESSGMYSISFVPPLPDIYTIDVLWGKFSANAIGESSGPIALEVDQDSKRECKVMFKPPVPDVYLVDVNWDGKPIPGSPFTIDLLPPAKPEAVECTIPLFTVPGEEAEVLVDVSNAGSGELRAYCTSGEEGEVDTNITSLGGRAYQVTFVPPDQDLYKLYITYNNQPVNNSPFVVDLRPGVEHEIGEIDESLYIAKPIPEKCMVTGMTESVMVKNMVNFTVDTQEAGVGEMDITVMVPSEKPGQYEPTTRITEVKRGVFDVEFTPNVPGEHVINIKWAGTEVPGSPYRVQVHEEVSPLRISPPVTEPKEISIPIGKVTKLRIKPQSNFQKSGKLEATVIGRENGQQTVEVSQDYEGVFTVKFNPTKPDHYVIVVKLNGEQVKMSPFYVHYYLEEVTSPPPSDSSKCKIIGKENLPEKVNTDQAISLLVDASKAGPGQLKVTAERPEEPGSPSVLDTHGENGIYQVEYTPKSHGFHRLSFLWAGDPIPDSPVILHALDLQRAPQYEFGKPIGIEMEVDGKQSDLKLKIFHKESGASVKGKLSKIQKGKFKVSFSPKIPGLYFIHLYLKDKEIPSSPYIVRYRRPAVASACKVVNLKEFSFFGDDLEFMVDAKEAGDGELAVKIAGPDKKQREPLSVKDNKDGTYVVTDQLKSVGDHMVHIHWSGKAIPSSPFHHEVRDLVSEQLFTSLYMKNRAGGRQYIELPGAHHTVPTKLDKTAIVQVKVLADELKNGELEATVTKANTGERFYVDVEKERDEFEILFSAPEAGLYTIDAKLDGKQVPNMPLNLDYEVAPPLASECRIIGLESHPPEFETNSKIKFGIDTRLAGDGKISIKAESPSGKPTLEAKANPEEKRIIDVTYTPTVPGTHRLKLLWSGEEIPRTPLAFNVVDTPTEESDHESSLIQDILDVFDIDRATGSTEDESKKWIEVPIGKELKIKVTPKSNAQRNGELRVRINGKEGEADVSQDSEGTFLVKFNPSQPDYYTIDVELNGEDVTSSPYYVHYYDVPKEERSPAPPVQEVFDVDVKKDDVFKIPDMPLWKSDFDVSSEGGELTAVCKGVNCGEIPVEKQETSPGSGKYKLKIKPKEPDLYYITVKVDDKEIERSPIKVDLREQEPKETLPPIDASKCRIIGKDHIPDKVDAGQAITVLVDASEAGPGQLSVTADTPLETDNPSTIDTHLKHGEKAIYQVDYTPNSQGHHRLNFIWVDEPIPDSPVDLNVLDLQNAPQYEFGKPIGLEMDVDGKQSDLKLKIFHKESGSPIKGKLSKIQKGRFKVSFSPKIPGLYFIHLYLKDKEIPSSPYIVRYRRPAVASACKVVNLKDTSFLGDDLEFMVDAKEAGDGDLSVMITGPDRKEREPLSVKDNRDGTYTVTDRPLAAGDHKINILWSDQAIPYSPFNHKVDEQLSTSLYMKNRAGGKKHIQLTGSNETIETELDKTSIVQVKVLADELKDREMKATVTYAETGERYRLDAEKDKDDFELSFIPSEAGLYTIDATLDGKQVPNMPLNLEYDNAAPVASECRILGLEDHPSKFQTNSKIYFQVDTRLAGDGKISLKAESPSGKPTLEAKANPEEKRIIDIAYTPTTPGTHRVNVLWSGEEVPRTPLEFNVEDEEPENGTSLIQDILDVFDIDSKQASTEDGPKKWIEVPIGKELKIKVTPKSNAQRNGELRVRINGKEGEADVSQDSEGTFLVKFNPSQPDYYTIDVALNGEDVTSSPYYVHYYDVPKEERPPAPPVQEVFDIDIKKDDVFKIPDMPLWKSGFDVSSEGGELTAVCKGVNCGEIPVEKQETSPGSGKYKLKIKPKEPDLYYITVKVDDKEIERSPIKVDLREQEPVTDASKCRIIGKDNIPGEVDVGREISVLVDATKAGPGQLKVTADTPQETESPSTINTSLKYGEQAIYQVDYTPNSQGRHKLNFTWADETIPDSPVVLDAVDLQNAPQYEYGKPIGLEMDVNGKQSDLKLKIFHKESGSPVKGKLSKIHKGRFKVSFSPKIPGLYFIHLYLKDKEIPSSPYIIRYRRPAVASACKVVNLKDTSFLGDDLEFMVDAKEAGDGKLDVKIAGPDKKDREPLSVKDNRDGTYTVTDRPLAAGDHKINILWSDKAIPYSPFHHKVRDLVSEQLVTTLYMKNRAGGRQHIQLDGANETVEAKVDKTAIVQVKVLADELKNSDLEATATHAKTGERYYVDIQKDRDEYEVLFAPPEAGLYTIDAMLDGKHVPNMPVNLDYDVATPVASECRILGLEDHPSKFQPDTKIRFQVDTRLAGDGKISIKAESPSGKPTLEAKANPEEKRIIDIAYTPNAPGMHRLKLLWSGEEIPKSPLSFKVEDIPEIPYGQDLTYSVDWMDVNESDLFSFFAPDGSDDRQDGTISKRDNHYTFSSQPTEPGLYKLSIFLRGTETWWSPVSVRYGEEPDKRTSLIEDIMDVFDFDQLKTKETDEPKKWVEIPIGKVLKIKVTPKTNAQRNGDLRVKINEREGEAGISQDTDGTFFVKFNPSKPDYYKIEVELNGEDVSPSPYYVHYYDVPKEERSPAPPVQEVFDVDIKKDDVFKIPDMPLWENDYDISSEGGELTAVCKGVNCGEIPVEKQETSPGSGKYKLKIKPKERDLYYITVKVDDKEIERSPFEVDLREPVREQEEESEPEETDRLPVSEDFDFVQKQDKPIALPETNPSKCRIINKESLPDVVDTERKVSILVDASEAGVGRLSVTADTPKGTVNPSAVDIYMKDEEEVIYQVDYTPNSQGHHRLNFTWADEPIPDSPVVLEAHDLHSAPQYEYGKPIGLEMDVDGKQSDLKLKIFHKESGSPIKGKLSKIHKGRFKVSFSPKIPGLYFIHLYLKDKEIPSSPYIVRYRRPAVASACKVVNLKDTSFLGDDLEFMVDAKEAGDGKLDVKIAGPDKKDREPLSVKDNRDGTYTVTDRPLAAGDHKINILWSDKAIPYSPFHHKVRDLVSEQLVTTLYMKNRAGGRQHIQLDSANETVEAKVDKTAIVQVKVLADELKNSDLEVTATHAKTGERYYVDIQKDRDEYEVLFAPPEAGLYTIDAMMDGKHVPSMPVNLDYDVATPVASECRILGLEDHPSKFQPDTKIRFQVDTRLAGDGKISIKAESPSGKPTLEAKANPEEKRIIDIAYTPNAPGTHRLKLLWSGEEIPKSPLSFKVEDIPEIPYGQDLTYRVDWMDVNESDLFSFFAPDGTDDKQDGTISKRDNHYTFSSQPTEPGLYKLSIFLRGTETWWSPVSVRYGEEPDKRTSLIEDIMDVFDFDQLKTKETDEPKKWVEIPIGKVLKIKVTPKTNAQRNGELRVRINGKEGEADVSQDSEGTFLVKFNPSQPDYYTIDVALNGEDVNSSPYYVHYYDVPKEERPPAPPVQEVFDVDIKKDDVFKIPDMPLWENDYDISSEGGELTAVCKGVNCGEIPVEKQETSPGSGKYKLKIKPKERDLYYITVKVDDKEIERSPIKVDLREQEPVTDASKCRIIDKDNIPGEVDVGREISVLVDATKAGPGQLKVTTDTPKETENPSTINTSLKYGEQAIYQVDYTPNSQGRHKLNFTWADETIPDSPVVLDAVDLQNAPQYEYGKPIGLEMDVNGKQSDLKLKIFHKESGSPVKGKLSKIHKGRFKVSFSPKIPGLYFIHLYLKDKEIPSSPYIIRYRRPAVASACKVVNLKDTSFLGDDLEFMVDAKEAGDGKLDVKIAGPDKKDREPLSVKDNRDGTYTVTDRPLAAGDHKINILWSDKAIPHSPFHHKVRDLVSEQLVTTLYMKNRAGGRQHIQLDGANETVEAKVDKTAIVQVKVLADELKNSDLEATATHAKTGERYYVDIQKDRDEYEVLFAPPEAGLYTIDAMLDGKHVPNMPVNLDYDVATPVASECRILGLEDHPSKFQPDTKIRFQVDTRLAGDGKISIKAESPSGKPTLEAKANPEEKRIIDIAYTPNAPGTHRLKLLWSGEEIPKSPLSFKVEDIPEIPYGQDLTYSVDWMDVNESDLFSFFAPDGSDDRQDGTISKRDNHYTFSSQPTEPGLYKLSIFLRGKETWWSPVSVRYGEEPDKRTSLIEDIMDVFDFDQLKTKETDEPKKWVEIPIGKVLKIKVTPKTNAQKNGDLRVKINEKEGEADISQDSEGTFLVKFNPSQPDYYTIDVELNGEDVSSSPYYVHYYDVPKEERPPAPPVQEVFDVDVKKDDVFKIPDMPPWENDYEVSSEGGELTAVCKGVNCGEIPVEKQETSPGSGKYKLKIKPKERDLYYITVKVDDKEIERSPFKVDLREPVREQEEESEPEQTDKPPVSEDFDFVQEQDRPRALPETHPSKCRIINKESLPDVVGTGKEVSILVDASKAGVGQLNVSTDTPTETFNPSTVDIHMKDEEEVIYQVDYTPNSQGRHKLNFTWGDEPIPDSPVVLNARDLHSAPQYDYGKPVGLEMDVDGKQSDLKLKIFHKESGSPVKGKLSKIQKGRFKVSFSPKTPGLYFIHLYLKDKEIPSSPYIVRYRRPAVASACKIYDLKESSFLGDDVEFLVDAKEAGDGELSVKFVRPDKKERAPSQINDNEDGTYSVSLHPDVTGDHKIYAYWSDKAIPSTPTQLKVKKREELITNLYMKNRIGKRQLVKFPSEGSILPTTTDKTAVLTVETRNEEQRNGKLVVTANNASTDERVQADVVKVKNVYEILFSPPEAGLYTIDATLDDKQVPNMPVTFDYTAPPPNASECKILGLEDHPSTFQVNTKYFVRVDTRLAGDGSLGVVARGPSGDSAVTAEPSPEDSRIIDVTCVPSVPGIHRVHLNWSGETIPRTPLSFNVEPIPIFPYGKPLSYSVSLADVSESDLAGHFYEENSRVRNKGKVSKVEKNRYSFSHKPKATGLYSLSIFVKNKEAKWSPVYVRHATPPNPDAVIIREIPEQGYISEPHSFLVDTREAGLSQLKVKVSSPKKGKDGELDITDNKDGTYTVQHVPEVQGTHSYAVTWEKKAVPKSPVKIKVLQKQEVKEIKISTLTSSLVEGVQKLYTKKPRILNLPTHPTPLGHPVDLEIDANNSGAGSLKISQKGDGQGEVKFSNRGNGIYGCTITPTKMGLCEFDITMNNESITYSPFTLDFCGVSGISLEGETLQVGAMHNFSVGCSEVKEANLEIYSVDSDAADIADINVLKDEDSNVYKCSILPKREGRFSIAVAYDGYQIVGSPFNVEFVKPTSSTMTFSLETPLGMEASNMSASMETSTQRQQIPVELNQLIGGQFSLDFIPTHDLEYLLTIKCLLKIKRKEVELAGGFFSLSYAQQELAAHVTQWSVEGTGIAQGTVGSWSTFIVQAEEGGVGELSVAFDDDDSVSSDPVVTPIEPSLKYEVKYLVKKSGKFKILLKSNGQLVAGSPFEVNCSMPSNLVSVQDHAGFPDIGEQGKPFQFSFKPQVPLSDGDIEVTAYSKSTGTVKGSYVVSDDGHYHCSFQPADQGSYSVLVKWDNKLVEGTPIALSVLEPSKPENVIVRGVDSKGAVGKKGGFTVNTRQAGRGTISVNITGPDQLQVSLEQDPDNVGQFQASYVPQTAGNYSMDIAWEKVSVPGSPFILSIV